MEGQAHEHTPGQPLMGNLGTVGGYSSSLQQCAMSCNTPMDPGDQTHMHASPSGSGIAVVASHHQLQQVNGMMPAPSRSVAGSAETNGSSLLKETPPEFCYTPKVTSMPDRKFVWNSQQEVASFLLAAVEHEEWISKEVRIRPPNGTMILYRRSVSVQARNLDGFTWKKKQKRRTVRESHMVLKLNGVECIFANYAHSAILPTFHRRAYFLRINPNIVLYHYLNVPPLTKDDKLCIPMPILSQTDLDLLTRDRLMDELRPMFNNFPTRLTKIDGKQILYFDVVSVIQAVAETVMSQRENRALPVISPDACFVFTMDSQRLAVGRQAITNCSSSPLPPASTSYIQAPSTSTPVSDTAAAILSNGSTYTSAPASSNTTFILAPDATVSQDQSGSYQQHQMVFNNVTSGCQFQQPTSLIGQETSMNGVQSSSSLSTPVHFVTVSANQMHHQNIVNQVSNQGFYFKVDHQQGQINSVPTTFVSGGGPPSQLHQTPICSQQQLQPPLSSSLPASDLPPHHTSSDEIPTAFMVLGDTVDNDLDAACIDNNDDSIDYMFMSDNDQLFPDLDLMDCFDWTCLTEMPRLDSTGASPSTPTQPQFSLPATQTSDTSNTTDASTTPNSTSNPSLVVCSNASLNMSTSHVVYTTAPKPSPQTTSSRQSQQQPSCSNANHSASNVASGNWSQCGTPQHSMKEEDMLAALVDVRHCAPEWAPTKGGDSVLLAGPWYSSRSPYSCYFGDIEVPANLVQNGVLSCLVPSHKAGSVQLQVACEGRIISRPIKFEYREIWSSSVPPSLTPAFSCSPTEDPQEENPPPMMSCGPGGDCKASSQERPCTASPDLSSMTLDQWVNVEDCILKVILVHKVSLLEQDIMHRKFSPTEAVPEPTELQETLPLEMLRVRRWQCRESLEVVLARCCVSWCRRALLPLSLKTHHGPPTHQSSVSSNASSSAPRPSGTQPTEASGSVGRDTVPQLCWPWDSVPMMSLCGALGYVELLRLLLVWFYLRKHQLTRMAPESQPEQDFETPSLDKFGLSPLVWACVRGHQTTARLITRWCPTMLHLNEVNSSKSPAEMAEAYGHPDIANELRLQEEQLLNGFGAYRPLSGVQYAALWDALSEDAVHLSGGLVGGMPPGSGPNMSNFRGCCFSRDDEDDDQDSIQDLLDSEDFDGLICGHMHALYGLGGMPPGMGVPLGSLGGQPSSHAAGGSGIGGMGTGGRPSSSSGCYSCEHDESGMVCLAGRIIQAMPRRIKFSPGPSATSSCASSAFLASSSMDDSSSLGTGVSGGVQGVPPPTPGCQLDRSASHSSFSSVTDQHHPHLHHTPHHGTTQYCIHGMQHCQGMPSGAPADDSGISTPFDEYRHANIDTPSSSVSPSGTGCACATSSSGYAQTGTDSISSPYNFSMDSPPPTTEEIAEHFNAPTTYMEADFSKLTLSDLEQKRLYEAAKVIQKCYRAYKQNKRRVSMPGSVVGGSGSKVPSNSTPCSIGGLTGGGVTTGGVQSGVGGVGGVQGGSMGPSGPSIGVGGDSGAVGGMGEREKEIEAAIIIQSYYRRYKQYVYYKRMCQAAVLIQNQYRWYVEQKKSAAATGSSGERLKRNKQSPVMVNQKFRNHYQRKQDPGCQTGKSLSCPETQVSLDSPSCPNNLPGCASQFHPAPATTTVDTSQPPPLTP